MDAKYVLQFFLAVAFIAGIIYYLETSKVKRPGDTAVTELTAENMPTEDKTKKFPAAKEIVSPAGFINTSPFTLKEFIGKQVILVDFWTYSCINCQRTLPYLNAWQEKYGNKGLTIVGIHTPEFEFEQKQENVEAAVTKFGVKYPVVLDNEYATWQAYGNRYWPRKYLIDIDGYIVYDHIGEGAYEETEKKIQELLQERSEKLGTNETIAGNIAQPTSVSVASTDVGTPEIYFGSQRNEYLGNGNKLRQGVQQLAAPDTLSLNRLYLDGGWDIQPEYATNISAPASIFFRYQAKDVYFVASAKSPVTMQVFRDGQPVGAFGGEDVDGSGSIIIQADRLYKLIEDKNVGEHTLELRVTSPGLQAYTFTFG